MIIDKRYNTSVHFYILVILLSSVIYAQNPVEDSLAGQLGSSFFMSTIFNADDINLGAGYGLIQPQWETGLYLFFLIRPYAKKVRILQASNYYIRYLENRFAVGINFDKYFLFSEKVGLSFSGGCAYSFAFYHGSSKDPDSEWMPVFGGDVFIIVQGVKIQAGYKYLPFPSVNNNQFEISIISGF